MKAVLIAFLFATSSLAQNPSAFPSQACGSGDVDFKVKLDNTQHTPAQAAPGKALVYFIHEAGTSSAHPLGYPTLKVGIDGAWVGANRGDSWFAVPVEPGEHHVCAILQSTVVNQRLELAHLQAEAGKAYYYRTRLVMSGQVGLLELDPLDSDQGGYLIGSYPLSVSHPKK
jgi:hypothetical protein